MSIQDDVRRLREIGKPERIPVDLLRSVEENVLLLNGEAKDLLGEGHGFYHGIGGCAAAIAEKLDAAIAACDEWCSAIQDAADRLEQGR